MAGLSEEEVCQTESSKEQDHCFGSGWFFPREQIEQHSPSRKDGISLVKENQLRKLYCVFLQDLGMRLKLCGIVFFCSGQAWHAKGGGHGLFSGLSGHLNVHGGGFLASSYIMCQYAYDEECRSPSGLKLALFPKWNRRGGSQPCHVRSCMQISPQMTIASSIVFCHRFFLRQSHAKNDRYTIATACMFLAGKVEETPKLLENVLFVSYAIRHMREKSAVERMKQKEVYNYERDRVLLAESLVLSTLDFDLNIIHPYKRLVTAVKKLKIVENSLAQVAWNFLNDGLRTSLCLQYEAHHIAAGGIFLAAKFLKIKLPTDGEKPWWQELEVTARQLEEVSNQMLELYEQHRDSTPSPRDPLAAVSSAAGSEAPSEVPPGTPQVAEKRFTKARAKAEVEVEGCVFCDRPTSHCVGLEKAASTGMPERSELVDSFNAEVEGGNLDGAVDNKRLHPRSCTQDCHDREPKRPCSSYVK